ncbi:MAG TPA: CRTAC1 family protein [Candidatus Limnocylindrales bacterium]|nr:CRTAC1 family protein [Candidatus Limnocylindrales bacterium]
MTHRRSRVVGTIVVVAVLVVVGAWIVVSLSSMNGRANQPPVAPRFLEEAQSAGVTHAYTGDFDYFVGGGVAAFDCNVDGLIDLYFAGGSQPAALFVNGSTAGGALAFERRAAGSTDLLAVTGAYPIDIDGDAIIDLVVLRRGGNHLLRGLGDCAFENANERWRFWDGAAGWSTAFSATWYGNESWPTIAIGNYLANSDPNALECADNMLFVPDDFAGIGFSASLPISPSWCTLSMLFSDWGRSGTRDLRVSNDRHYYRADSDGQEQLWALRPPTDPAAYTAVDGWRTVRIWGMGIASTDLTGDGLPEYYLTSQGDNKLQTLADGPARPTYADVALELGATAHRPFEGDTIKPSTAWHAEFQDVNNDTLMDLFVAKGNVEAMPDYAAQDPNNLLIGQSDGSFKEGAQEAGIVDFARARGAGLVDLNLDGMLDLVVVNRIENVRLYRNVGSGTAVRPSQQGNWLQVRAQQPGGNSYAIGAWIEVRTAATTQIRELTIGGGHASGQLGPIHFGLGPDDEAEVRVTWPDGAVGPWQPVAANQRVLVERGAAAPVPLQ